MLVESENFEGILKILDKEFILIQLIFWMERTLHCVKRKYALYAENVKLKHFQAKKFKKNKTQYSIYINYFQSKKLIYNSINFLNLFDCCEKNIYNLIFHV